MNKTSISELKANLEKAASDLNAAVEGRKKELLEELRELGHVAGAASERRVSYPGLTEKVRGVLRNSGDPMTMAQIGALCGVPGVAIARASAILVRAGTNESGRATYLLRSARK